MCVLSYAGRKRAKNRNELGEKAVLLVPRAGQQAWASSAGSASGVRVVRTLGSKEAAHSTGGVMSTRTLTVACPLTCPAPSKAQNCATHRATQGDTLQHDTPQTTVYHRATQGDAGRHTATRHTTHHSTSQGDAGRHTATRHTTHHSTSQGDAGWHTATQHTAHPSASQQIRDKRVNPALAT